MAKKKATPQENRKKRNARYMRDTYSDVRKERYENDPEYRAQIVERERKAYAEKHNMTPKDYGGNVGLAASYAGQKKVYKSEDSWDTTKRQVLTKPQMAKFLNAGEKVFAGWVGSGKFPPPNLWCVGDYFAYSIATANKLAQILLTGLEGRGSFRETDTDLIERLHAVK